MPRPDSVQSALGVGHLMTVTKSVSTFGFVFTYSHIAEANHCNVLVRYRVDFDYYLLPESLRDCGFRPLVRYPSKDFYSARSLTLFWKALHGKELTTLEQRSAILLLLMKVLNDAA